MASRCGRTLWDIQTFFFLNVWSQTCKKFCTCKQLFCRIWILFAKIGTYHYISRGVDVNCQFHEDMIPDCVVGFRLELPYLISKHCETSNGRVSYKPGWMPFIFGTVRVRIASSSFPFQREKCRALMCVRTVCPLNVIWSDNSCIKSLFARAETNINIRTHFVVLIPNVFSALNQFAHAVSVLKESRDLYCARFVQTTLGRTFLHCQPSVGNSNHISTIHREETIH